MPASKKAVSASQPAASKKNVGDRWSRHVTETSDAMDLKPDVFKQHDAAAIARSVKSSAEHSHRRKAAPFQSAMSMLNFYINRAGHNLEASQRKTLEDAKEVLRTLFGREPADAPAAPKSAARSATKKTAAKKVVAKKVVAKKAATKKAATKKAAPKTAAAKRA